MLWKRNKQDRAQMHEIIHRAEEAGEQISRLSPAIDERSARLGLRLRQNGLGPALTMAFQRQERFQ